MSRLGALSASAMRAAKTSSYWAARVTYKPSGTAVVGPFAEQVWTDSDGTSFVAMPGTNTTLQGILAKYDKDGNRQWIYSYSGLATDTNWVRDYSGNFYGYSFIQRNVVKVNSSGTVVWGLGSFASGGSGSIDSIAIDPSSGTLYVAGVFASVTPKFFTIDTSGAIGAGRSLLARGQLAYVGGNIYFSGRATTTSNYIQQLPTNFGSTGIANWSYSITGSSVNPYFIGRFVSDNSGTPYFTGTHLPTSTSTSATNRNLIMKFDSSGNITWARILNDSTGGYISDISFDSSNNPYWVSLIDGSGGQNGQISKMDSSGNLTWRNGTTWSSFYASVREFKMSIQGTTIWIGGILLLKVPTNGTKTGTYSFSTPTNTYTYGSNSLTNSSQSYSTLTAFTASTAGSQTITGTAYTPTRTDVSSAWTPQKYAIS
jgi:hypothetical protein